MSSSSEVADAMGAEDEHRNLDLTAIRQPPPTLSFAALCRSLHVSARKSASFS